MTKDRNTHRREGDGFAYAVGASVKIFAGAIVALNATGYATPGAVATTLKSRGIAQELADNSAGADGAITVDVRRGVFRVGNDGTVTIADIGNDAYIVDDQTVADNNGTGTRSVAGKIVDVDADGVWVEFI